MNRETFSLFWLLFLLLAAGYTPTISAQILATVPNIDQLIVATIGEPDSVDPAWAYDTASAELIFNVYETLIRFDYEKVDHFLPCLATEWTIEDISETSPEDLTWVQRYTFEIREDVGFHDDSLLSTEDVEYSFERWMVQNRLGGPSWMIYKPLLGVWYANLSDSTFHLKIDNAVQSNATHIWFNLITSYAPFLQILSQSWSSIVDKEFSIAHGCWPGTWENWQDYHDPDVSPLDTGGDWMCGTGPYMLDYWSHGVEWSIVKFDDYWGGWPGEESSNYVSRAKVKVVDNWNERYDGFIAGEYDIIPVPHDYISSVEGQPGVRYIKDLPALMYSALFFNFNISTTSTLMGVPGGLPPSTFNETGIPPDFFSDVHIRRGFAYGFNYTKYIEDPYRYNGEAKQPASPVIEGLPYHNPLQEKYSLDLAKAEEEFKLAWNGQVWDDGFSLTIIHHVSSLPPVGNWPYVLKANLESLNPKFHVSIGEFIWYEYFQLLVARELPMFLIGWGADYPDPHNFVYPFMHSNGDFAYFQSYSDATVDALVEEGLKIMNPTTRREIYYELQSIYHNDVPSVPVAQPLGRHWERDWVQGWYYNPDYPGLYFYHLWKGLDGDTNGDGTVDMLDAGLISAHWSPGPPVGPLGYNRKADINPVLAYPLDGRVDIADAALINAHWGEEVAP